MNRKTHLCTAVAMALATNGGIAIADERDEDEDEIEFDVAEVFFELNHTDGDLGIHALIDGEPWKHLVIADQNERRVLNVNVRGRLRRQGLTEIFFESAEPEFDELAPAEFFDRFPEGTYEVEGWTLEGKELGGDSDLTHRMPAPPAPLVNGVAMAVQCDDEEPGYDATMVATPVVISWPAVVSTHPDLGYPQGSPDITIRNYEVVVETDLEGADGEEFTTVFSAVVPPTVTTMSIPDEFLGQSDTFKYEVLVREETWNQTAVESCFEIDGDE